MLKLPLKRSINNEIEVLGVKFKIDYPTPEQDEKIQEIILSMGIKSDPKGYQRELGALYRKAESLKDDQGNPELKEVGEKISELELLMMEDQKYKKIYDENLKLYVKLKRLAIKFCVKGFSGLNDESGNPVECKLIDLESGTELEKNLWWRIVKDTSVMNSLFEAIQTEIEFLPVDKKK